MPSMELVGESSRPFVGQYGDFSVGGCVWQAVYRPHVCSIWNVVWIGVGRDRLRGQLLAFRATTEEISATIRRNDGR